VASFGRPLRRVEGELDEGCRGGAGREVGVGDQPDAVAPRVRREQVTGGLDVAGDPSESGDALGHRAVGLEDVEASLTDELGELVRLAGELAAGDPHVDV